MQVSLARSRGERALEKLHWIRLSNVQEQRGVNLTSETQRTIKKKNVRKQSMIENKEREKNKER